MLRSRAARREDPLDVHVPDPVVEFGDEVDPAEQSVLADSVGLALLVVLESLEPAQRLAYVLHDMFAVPFEEIAPMLERTPAAARQLASRARRRIQGATPSGRPDRVRQRGAAAIAGQATRHRTPGLQARFATVNGGPGIVATVDGRPTSVLASPIADGLITEVDILTDLRRLAALDLPRKLTPQGHPR
jgi:hypothetical protein